MSKSIYLSEAPLLHFKTEEILFITGLLKKIGKYICVYRHTCKYIHLVLSQSVNGDLQHSCDVSKTEGKSHFQCITLLREICAF